MHTVTSCVMQRDEEMQWRSRSPPRRASGYLRYIRVPGAANNENAQAEAPRPRGLSHPPASRPPRLRGEARMHARMSADPGPKIANRNRQSRIEQPLACVPTSSRPHSVSDVYDVVQP
eukprot:7336334-Prymnesium_polylepis.2